MNLCVNPTLHSKHCGQLWECPSSGTVRSDTPLVPEGAPDKNCYTLSDGSCVGVGCMHDPEEATWD